MADSDLKTRKSNSNADAEHLWSTVHSLNTVQGITGQAHNRYMSGAATTWATATNECTFASPGVNEVTVSVPTQTNLTEVLMLADSPSDAYTNSVLTSIPATTVTTDFPMSPILPNTTKTYIFSSPITRLDFLPIGTACAIFVEAT